MFRHQGKSRTFAHNLQLAIVLSMVAGIVNVTGFLAFAQLTTNVTGHFALFIQDVADFRLWQGTVYFAYIAAFFFGSFFSSYLIEKFKANKRLNVYVIPIAIQSVILILVALGDRFGFLTDVDGMACLLLFAMGLQNSYVTKISNTIVRTTHLTGLFTDLGIEISQLLFPKNHPNQEQIRAHIRLRVSIISFFLVGGLLGGFLFSRLDLGLNTLLVAVLILWGSLFYDDLGFRRELRKRKNRPMQEPGMP